MLQRPVAGDRRKEGRQDSRRRHFARALGLGLITGAADDDPSAIGTLASAGAKFGPALLWTVPVLLPMMFTVVYLSSKLGQASGKGLFDVLRDHYPRWLLWPVLIGVLIGNTIEAAADLAGMAAAITIFVPVPVPAVVCAIALVLLVLQFWGSYTLIRNVFRWLTLALLGYVGAALLAKPDAAEVLRGTLLPTIEFSHDYLSMLVAIIGTTLSAYLFTWQSNVEVEEEIAQGRTKVSQRRGTTEEELRTTQLDVWSGILFSGVIIYFIMLSTAATLHSSGKTDIDSAVQAAEALAPIAGQAAGLLFLLGMIGVGFLAVPIMTTGAAYDLAQVMGWKSSLNAKPWRAKRFYALIAAFTCIAVAMNFIGINPMRALVYAGIVQGFSTPPLLLLILLMTSSRRIMGSATNSLPMRALGWVTVCATFAASAGLVLTWAL